MFFENTFLPLFAIGVLILVFFIDTQLRAQRKESKKYDYLFTNRHRRASIGRTLTKGYNEKNLDDLKSPSKYDN